MPVGYVGANGNWVTAADQPAQSAGLNPIILTAGQIAAPTPEQIANVFATFQLDVAPFTRYHSNGTTLVDSSLA